MDTGKRLTNKFTLGLGIALGLASSICADDVTPDAVVPYKSIGDRTLHLHVFIPETHAASDRRPAIVFFSGGGWNNQNPQQFYTHARYLATRGMVAMAAEYRVKKTDESTPLESVTDAKSAMRWVRARAEEMGIDPERIAAGGGSAGGQMAAATATVSGFDDPSDDLSVNPRPQALVLFNPVYDNGPDGFGQSRMGEHWEAVSPMHNIAPGIPPSIVFLGTEDRLIPVEVAERFQQRVRDVGGRSDLHLYEGQPHAFFNYRGGRNPYYYKTVIEMDRFLASLGYIEGEPTMKEP